MFFFSGYSVWMSEEEGCQESWQEEDSELEFEHPSSLFTVNILQLNIFIFFWIYNWIERGAWGGEREKCGQDYVTYRIMNETPFFSSYLPFVWCTIINYVEKYNMI